MGCIKTKKIIKVTSPFENNQSNNDKIQNNNIFIHYIGKNINNNISKDFFDKIKKDQNLKLSHSGSQILEIKNLLNNDDQSKSNFSRINSTYSVSNADKDKESDIFKLTNNSLNDHINKELKFEEKYKIINEENYDFYFPSYKIKLNKSESDKEEFFTYSYKLPDQTEEFLFSFEKKDYRWYLKDNGIVSAIGSLNKEIIPYKSFDVKILGHNDLISLWALPEEEANLYNLSTDNILEITIGSAQNTICYKYTEIAPLEASIKYTDNKHILQVINDNKYRVYLNNNRVTSSKELKIGDVLFIDGLIIIWMESFMTINNPNNAIGVTGLKAYNMPASLDNTNVEPISDEDQNYKLYSEDDYFFHIPRIREIFEEEEIEIDTPPAPRNREDMPWYLKLGTSLMMLVSSFVMGINIFNSISTS